MTTVTEQHEGFTISFGENKALAARETVTPYPLDFYCWNPFLGNFSAILHQADNNCKQVYFLACRRWLTRKSFFLSSV